MHKLEVLGWSGDGKLKIFIHAAIEKVLNCFTGPKGDESCIKFPKEELIQKDLFHELGSKVFEIEFLEWPKFMRWMA